MFWRFHFFGKTPFCGRVCMFWKLIFFEGSIWGANWNVLRAPFLRRIGVGFSWEVCEYYFHPCLKTYVHDMAKLNPFMQDSFTDCAFSLVSYIYITRAFFGSSVSDKEKDGSVEFARRRPEVWRGQWSCAQEPHQKLARYPKPGHPCWWQEAWRAGE